MSYRKDKIERMIKEELGWIFIHKLKDPALGFITITNVKVSPDLKLAKVYLSVFQKENRKKTLDKVYELKGLIRSELAHKIKIRFVPDLDFYIDDTPDYVEKMENLFRKIHDQEAQTSAGESPSGSDSSAGHDAAAKDERDDD
ncbi:MAG: 30S ribosome-binding factor RbfA [Bacteroidota bacterium]